MSTPNILFILSDQQRWDSVECYGRPIFPGLTPRLDEMAADGVRFQHTFTPQPVCGPARSCLQTGQFTTRTGCFTNYRGLPDGQRTIAHALGDAGYSTAYIGKWHLGGRWEGYKDNKTSIKPVLENCRGGYRDFWLAAEALEHTSHGFAGYLYDGENNKVEFKGYRPDKLTDYALEFLQRYNDEAPFFLFLSYIEPHHQNDMNCYIGPEGSKERFKDYNLPGDLEALDGFWVNELPDYLGCCWSLDQNVGRILDELTRLGIRENTLVVYTSDHGDHFGTRNGESKRSPHESSIRVPLIINGPGFKGGKVVEDMVSLIDLPPTLLAATGAPVPESMDGRPVQDLMDPSTHDWPEEAFIQVSEEMVGRAIRTRRWKYAVHAPWLNGNEDSCSDEYGELFLYDLDQDPHELNNLIEDPGLAEVRKDLAARLIRWMERAGEGVPTILTHDSD